MADGASKSPAAEVGVKLVLDTNAKAVTDEVAKGLSHVDDKTGKAKRMIDTSLSANAGSLKTLAMGYMGLRAAATAAMVGGVITLAGRAAHAFQEDQAEARALAGTLLMIDQRGNSFKNLFGYANDLKDQFDELAEAAGTTDDAVQGIFTDVIERGGKTVDEARELTESMVYAGRAFPQGAAAIAQGFEMMQMGMIRARNPIVQLIASTGTLKGSAKTVAHELQKMPIDKQMELAEKAIAKMGDKMKDVPMTMGQATASIHQLEKVALEEAGKPIIEAFSPAVKKVRDAFYENRDAINSVAADFGSTLGKGIAVIPLVIDEVMLLVKKNAGDLKAAVKEITDPLKEVFEYVYENRHAFAKTIAEVVVMLAKAGVAMVKSMLSVYEMIAKVFKWVAMTGVLGKDVKTGIGEDMMSAQAKDVRAKVMAGSMTGDQGAASLADKEAARQKFAQTYAETYGSEKFVEGLDRFNATWQRAVDDHNAVMRVATENSAAARLGDSMSFAKAWDAARKAEDQGAQNYVAQFLFNNKALVKALGEEGPKLLGDGFDALIDNLRGQGTLGSDIAAEIKKGARPNLGIDPKAHITQNFNGPINVKQDFRDQDPDRVAVVFREDMARVGTNRLQSRFAAPFSF